MPVTSVATDPEALTMTLVAEFPVPVQRLWAAFADARQLERFWGPPGYPATFLDFDLGPGNRASYWMTTPEGERLHAFWDILEVNEPRSIVVSDRLAHASGDVDESMPAVRMTLTFDETDNGSRLTNLSSFESSEALEQAVEMGMVQGITEGLAQLDVVLADLREYALGKGTQVEIMDDTHVRITRGFEAPRHLLWRAHTEPELMKQWLLGPDGWVMTVCEVDTSEGGAYRYAWAPEAGHPGEPFGFEGETVVFTPERRMVTTERMTGADFPGTVNDLSFDEVDGVTLLTLYVTYASQEQRDMILATGMTEGMETSYARLERELISDL
ncbi:MAG: SRPBCC family protein [Rhodoglobus sp.]